MNMVVSHWSVSVLVVAILVAVVAAHVRGVHRQVADARRGREGVPAGIAREAAAFYAGLLAVLLALVSPAGYWAQRFIWVRSMQDVLLAIVAPALIVLGAPWLALRRGLVRGVRQGRGRAAIEPRGHALGWLPWPVAVTVTFNVVWCGWHLPVLYDTARAQPLVFACEVISYLGFGVLFWLQLIGSAPHAPALAPVRRVTLLVGTTVIGAGLAVAGVFSSAVLYPGYLGRGHHALSVVADQQVGGAVLWVVPLVPYFIATVALLIRWLSDEESADLAAGFDRLLRPAKSSWPSRPGLRSSR